MKTLMTRTALLIALILTACDENEKFLADPAKIQFKESQIQVFENSSAYVVELLMDRPATSNSTIVLKLNRDVSSRLNVVPSPDDQLLKLIILKGQSSTRVILNPINNGIKDGDLEFSLSTVLLTGELISGEKNLVSVRLKDDDNTPTPSASVANFVQSEIKLNEADQSGVLYEIILSSPVESDGKILIGVNSENALNDVNYFTEPAAVDGRIILPVVKGTSRVSFVAKPIANAIITGEMSIRFSITDTEGPIVKGNIVSHDLTIKDDELLYKPRGYEITAGNSISKKFFEYDQYGRIARVMWENYTPFLSRGTDTYFYNQEGQLIKINKAPGRDINYRWLNGRIEKSERMVEGVLQEYVEYGYDDEGRISLVTSFHRAADGSFIKGMYTLYLYFIDGNIYKTLTYTDNANSNEATLISTRTYDNYLDEDNKFPMVEIIPGVRSQTKIPGSYRVEEYMVDKTYSITYVHRPDGLLEKRFASTPGETQTAVYFYYE